MPAEEQHYLQSEIDRLTEERFWLLLEIMVLAALFYEIVTYQKEKLNIKRLGIKLIGQGLLIWYAYSTVNKIWNVVELYYNRQEVKKYEHIEVRLNNHNFHTPDHYFSDATVEEYTSFRVLCLTL